MRYDAIVIGGGYAGLSGAMILARGRRRILVVDAGMPRNRFAAHSHGVLAQDGRPGSEILADARAQLAAYPTVAFAHATATEVTGSDGAFSVRLDDGATAEGRKVLLAIGMADTLPDVPGVAERWGRTVLHCPYCHGYEIGGGAIGVLAASPLSAHQAALVADWGDVTLFTRGVAFDADALSLLARRGVAIEETPVAAVEGPEGEIDGVRLTDGRLVPARAVFVGTSLRITSPIPAALGCETEETPMGTILRTDAQKQTTVPGVFAAGDAALVPGNITLASADGVRAGLGVHASLIFGG